MNDLDFAPLQLRKTIVKKSAAIQYRILRADGESVVVEAESAAEALARSGVRDAVKIVNMEFESQVAVEPRQLVEQEGAVATAISLDETRRAEFLLAELGIDEGVQERFELLPLGALAGLSAHLPQPAAPEPVAPEPTAPQPAAVEPVMEASPVSEPEETEMPEPPQPVEEVASEPVVQAAEPVAVEPPYTPPHIVEQELLLPEVEASEQERQAVEAAPLSAEEVRRLLNGEGV